VFVCFIIKVICGEIMKNINVGIIGLGKMGILHTGILNSFDDVNVVAIAEKEKLMSSNIKKVLKNVNTYNDYQKMFNKEDLDLVYIATPTAFHTNISKDCAESGINFFVEKPLGISKDDCNGLIKLMNDKKDIINMVGYCKHFVDTFAKAKEILDSKILGEPLYLNSHMYVSQLFSKGKGWRYKKESSGGGVLNILATHLVDVLLWYFGDIVTVSGNSKSYYSNEVEDFIHSHLTFNSGLEGHLDASWSVRNYRLPEIKIEVQCSEGMLVVNDDYIKYYEDSKEGFTTLYKQDLYTGVEVDIGGPEYTRENRHMVNCVKNNKKSDIDIFYGYKVQCVNDSIYKSAEERKTVDVEYGVI
jgi:predicted dehydrogenase